MGKKSSFQPVDADRPLRVLFAASEAWPLIKTGGLADVSGSLPPALRREGLDVRLIIPAYPIAVERAIPLKTAATLRIPGVVEPIRLLEGKIGDSLPVYLVEIPGIFDRQGNPYTNAEGKEWPDNPRRFALFSRVIASIAMGRAGIGWQPEVVHCNDWQTGLVAPLLAPEWNRPATIFTIHNLSYQGVYDRRTFDQLGLSKALWSPNGVEFHGNLSLIKGGLAFSDWVTAVSPTYAAEIRTPQFGYGLEGLLNHRADRLVGVLNGIDYHEWDPASDPLIPHHYDADTLQSKQGNKRDLQGRMGLEQAADALLFGHIGRMVEQKGVDLILAILPRLMDLDRVQLVVLGSGEPGLEQRMREAAERHPGKVAVHIGYDEALAHQIEAGSDAFLMPSRFEPCGLNQLYSLRYGTVPVVHRTGGLADTVVDCNPQTQLEKSATGFVFDRPDDDAFWRTAERVVEYYRRPGVFWERLATNGMRQDFSWEASARHYIEIYRRAIEQPAPNPVA